MISPRHREPNGRQQRPESREERERMAIMSVALAQPHRKVRSVPKDDPRLGHALGRLYLAGLLNADQYQTGGRYGRLAIRHGRLVTGKVVAFPAPVFEMAAGGMDCRPEPDDEQVFELRREWGDAQSALCELRDAHSANRILAKICIMDKDLTHEEVGTLREALNVLHNLWR